MYKFYELIKTLNLMIWKTLNFQFRFLDLI